jgi:hypothetical protein
MRHTGARAADEGSAAVAVCLYLLLCCGVRVVLWAKGGGPAYSLNVQPAQRQAISARVDTARRAGLDVRYLEGADEGTKVSRFENQARYVLAVVVGWVVARWIGPWPAALVPAADLVLQYWLSERSLRHFSGRGDDRTSTPGSQVVEWLFRVVALAVAVVGFGGLWAPLPTGFRALPAAPALLALGAFVVTLLAAWLEKLGRRLGVLLRRQTVVTQVRDVSYLYLRSFGDDRTRAYSPVADGGGQARVWPWVRFEEILAAGARTSADVVAIGDPHERLPLAGARRVYYRRDKAEPTAPWRDAVRVAAAGAKAVLLVAGETQGVQWEISRQQDWGLLGKAFFIVPPCPDGHAWVRLSALFEALGMAAQLEAARDVLPVGHVVAVTVGEDRTPTYWLAPARSGRAYWGLMRVIWLVGERGSTQGLFEPGDTSSAALDHPETRPVDPTGPEAAAWAVWQRAFDLYNLGRHADALPQLHDALHLALPLEWIGPNPAVPRVQFVQMWCAVARNCADAVMKAGLEATSGLLVTIGDDLMVGAEVTGNSRWLADGRLISGTSRLQATPGDPEGIERLRLAADTYRQAGDLRNASGALLAAGSGLAEAGHLDEADAAFAEAVTTVEFMGHGETAASFSCLAAECLLNAGDSARARVWADRARSSRYAQRPSVRQSLERVVTLLGEAA